MAEVLRIFQNLSQFYEANEFNRDEVDEIYEKYENFKKNQKQKTVPLELNQKNLKDLIDSIENMCIVKNAVNDSRVLSSLLELCATIRALRESNQMYDNTFDCWDRVIEISPKEQYLTFISVLLGLAKYNIKSKMHRKLTIAAARAYILSLTIPGSKGFEIFDDKVIVNAIEVLNVPTQIEEEKISRQACTEDWVNISNFCDDLKILFRYVHFEEYEDLKNNILYEIIKILYRNHKNGYVNLYAKELQNKCFEILDEVTNAHNGDLESTFTKIMKLTFCLHIFPRIPKSHDNFCLNTTQFCEHISDWFVTAINKFPRIVTKVIKHFIKCVVTNAEKTWRTEQLQRVFDYAVKYDVAMYTKCNDSNVPFLCYAINANDEHIRSNAVEILSRLLLIEAEVNWEVFRHEISMIPRETEIIKVMLIHLLDSNNAVKLKILNGISNALQRGNQNTCKILTEGIKFAIFDEENVNLPIEPRIRCNEVRYEKPNPLEPSYTFEGNEILQPLFKNLPKILFVSASSSSAHVRRATLILLQNIVLLNPLVIYNTKFIKEISKFGDDISPLVRKQALLTIDAILLHYTNCYPVVYAWCSIITPLFSDSDSKIVDKAWECFKNKVFNNIKGIENSNKAEHFMPWVILRVLLLTQNRQFLQSCIQSAIKNQMINEKSLSYLESHILTSNSTEAWIMLSFVAGHIKCKEPDGLISAFIKSMFEQSWNVGQNLQIILEVLVIWINDFSHSALNMAFSCIVNFLKAGNIPLNVISKAFSFCVTVNKKSESNKNLSSNNELNIFPNTWMEDLYKTAENYLLKNLNSFTTNRSLFMQFLYIYSEANVELMYHPNEKIVQFIYNCLREYIKLPNDDFESDNINIINQMIPLAARFSIRDAKQAEYAIRLFRVILRKFDRPTTINNIIICLTDLSKRHTQIVEKSLPEILLKLKSPYSEIRLVTFKNIELLIMQDLLKLRGNLLLALMITLLDENQLLSNIATEFFMTYLEKKNQFLFQSCLIECPFIYNEYLNFEGFESFHPSEMQILSPLKGEQNFKNRKKLYKMFLYEQEEAIMLMYLKNLKMLYVKIENENTINSPEGKAMIRDMLYIFTKICIYSLESTDSKISSNSTNAEEEVNNIEELNEQSNSKLSKKDRKKHFVPTINDAISLVEKMIFFIPKIANIIIKWDRMFEKSIKELCIAVWKRFKSFVEYASPKEFWMKYKPNIKTSSQRKRKQNSDQNISDMSDNSEPGINSNSNKHRKTLEDNLIAKPVSLLFQPFL